jgi:hypothetical protein
VTKIIVCQNICIVIAQNRSSTQQGFSWSWGVKDGAKRMNKQELFCPCKSSCFHFNIITYSITFDVVFSYSVSSEKNDGTFQSLQKYLRELKEELSSSHCWWHHKQFLKVLLMDAPCSSFVMSYATFHIQKYYVQQPGHCILRNGLGVIFVVALLAKRLLYTTEEICSNCVT